MASVFVLVVYLQMRAIMWHSRWQPLPRASDTDSDTIMKHKNAKCCDAISGAVLEQICASSGFTMHNYGPPECTCVDYFYCKLVVVSSVSSNHFEEIKDMIASVQTHMPNTTLIVYSLGLTDTEEQVLRSYCNLELRIFDFDKYPSLSYSRQDLQKYGWKPLVVQEVSDEFEVILYFDCSIRLMSPINGTLLRHLILSRPAFLIGSLVGKKCATPHLPIVSFTHDVMLKYLFPKKSQDLPGLRQELAVWGHIQSGCWLMWFTSEVREKILNNWVDCALHEECMAPKDASIFGCRQNFIDEYGPKGKFIGCHRYDQSSLNLIIYREFGLSSIDHICHSFVFEFFLVKREPTHLYKEICIIKECMHEIGSNLRLMLACTNLILMNYIAM